MSPNPVRNIEPYRIPLKKVAYLSRRRIIGGSAKTFP